MPFWKIRSPYTFPLTFWKAMEQTPADPPFYLVHHGTLVEVRAVQQRWQLFRMCLRKFGEVEARLDGKYIRRARVVADAAGISLLLHVTSPRADVRSVFEAALSSERNS
jgi:hypothetical protein